MNVRKFLIASGLALVSSVAVAGLTEAVEVEVDLDNKNAFGDMRTARNAKDNDVHIGCGIRVTDDGISPLLAFGFCQATDADGETVFCVTQSQVLMSTMGAYNDNSFIRFVWNENGECTHVGISTQSFYLPKSGK